MGNLAFKQAGEGLQHLNNQATVSQCLVLGKSCNENAINVLKTIARESGNGRVEGTDLLAAASKEDVTIVQSPSYVTQRKDANQEYIYDSERNENIGQLNQNGPAPLMPS